MKNALALIILCMSLNVFADGLDCEDIRKKPDYVKKNANLLRIKKSGTEQEQFMAHLESAQDYCLSEKERSLSKAALVNLGKKLALAAEKRGDFYRSDDIHEKKPVSAFIWYEEIEDYKNADRVLLLATKAQPRNISALNHALNISKPGARFMRGPGPQYESSPEFKKELILITRNQVNTILQEEEKVGPGIQNAAMMDVANVSISSLNLLKEAREWAKLLPEGDKIVKARAEKRGDQVDARSDTAMMGGLAVDYYELAGSSKARKQREKGEATQKQIEKSAEAVKKSFQQQSKSETEKFKKGTSDLEKELDF